MAEFKLDRIRFRYRGDWSAATNYVKDDVIRFGAKVYVCIEVHQADANFYNDLNNSTLSQSSTLVAILIMIQ